MPRDQQSGKSRKMGEIGGRPVLLFFAVLVAFALLAGSGCKSTGAGGSNTKPADEAKLPEGDPLLGQVQPRQKGPFENPTPIQTPEERKKRGMTSTSGSTNSALAQPIPPAEPLDGSRKFGIPDTQ